MKTASLTFTLLAALFVSASSPRAASAEAATARDIVVAADKVRNPDGAFKATVSLVEYVEGRARDTVVLKNHVLFDPGTRQFRNLVRYVGPPRDAGKLVLLSAGNMWFYNPSSGSSIRISPQQRLSGQASNGDVLTANFALDYTPRLVGEEVVQDADKVERRANHLELTRATPEATYARLEYWVEQGTSRAVKAKFYSDSGRVLKIAYYRRYETQLGGTRPTETIIIDAINPALVTRIAYSEFAREATDAAWFQRDYLPRFREE